MKKISMTFLAFGLGIILSSCMSLKKDDELAAEFAKKTLRVGVETNLPPLIFKDGSGKICGMEADFAEDASVILGAKLEFVQVEWTNIIQGLLDDKYDVIMSGMTITREREKLVKFTNPYIRAGQMAIVRTSDIKDFYSVEKILSTRRTIGFLSGSTGEIFVKEKCPEAKKLPFKTADMAVKALLSGEIDVFIADAPLIWVISDTRITPICRLLTEEYLGWAVRPDDASTLEAMNGVIDILNKKGLLRETESKWIPELIMNQIYLEP